MSQQSLNTRRSMRIVARHKKLAIAAVLAGLAGGAGYAVVNPPSMSASALVALPAAPAGTANVNLPATGSAVTQYATTQAIIAASLPVLSRADQSLTPPAGLLALRKRVTVTATTSYLLSVSATGLDAAAAEAEANAVAKSYVSYVTARNSPVGQVAARLLEPARVASGPGRPVYTVIAGLLGALLGALTGVVAALAVGRGDRRLRERDEIAHALGVPVLASLPGSRPSGAPGWAQLLTEYQPAAMHAWRLRTALRQLGMLPPGPDGPAPAIAVLSLSGDPAALSLGPQLATVAAEQGMRVTLTVGPVLDPDPAAGLRTACERAADQAITLRDGRLVPSRHPRAGGGADLNVLVAVLDGASPTLPALPPLTATLLAVSSGSATGEQLAQVAVSAAALGYEIAGILVANPEPGDRTTGRAPLLPRPTRLLGRADPADHPVPPATAPEPGPEVRT